MLRDAAEQAKRAMHKQIAIFIVNRKNTWIPQMYVTELTLVLVLPIVTLVKFICHPIIYIPADHVFCIVLSIILHSFCVAFLMK